MLPKQESSFPISLVGARLCLPLCASREPSPLLSYSWWPREVTRLSLADKVFLPESPCWWDHPFSRGPEDTETVAVGIQMASGTGPGWWSDHLWFLPGSARSRPVHPTVCDALQTHQGCASAALGICTTTPSQTFSQSPFLL